jgi:mRNA interferase RelE/StbE
LKPYQVSFSPEAVRDLKKLDRSVGKLILSELEWLAAHVDKVKHRPLKHDLKGKFKLRVGDWRVVYELHPKLSTLDVLFIGHRREVYD